MTTATPSLDVLPAPGLLIGSTLVGKSSGGTHDHIYPGSGALTAPVPLAGAEEIDLAVRTAREAFREWKAMPADARRKVLLRVAAVVREHTAELADLVILENGTPHPFAQAYPELVADLFEYNRGGPTRSRVRSSRPGRSRRSTTRSRSPTASSASSSPGTLRSAPPA